MKRLALAAAATLLFAAGSLVYFTSHRQLPSAELTNAPGKAPPPGPTGPGLSSQPAPTVSSAQGPALSPTSNPKVEAASASPPAATSGTTSPATRKRTWDPNYLASLKGVTQGESIRFELADGQYAEGTIEHMEHQANEVVYISGKVSSPEVGRFFFQKQSLPGKAGAFVGVVELPTSQTAWRIEPQGQGGASELVERTLNNVVCLRLPLPAENATNQTEEIPPLKPADFPTVPIPDYQKGIIVLESLPRSTPVIYLDFQGGYTPTWGGITYDRPSVSNSQIKDVWVRVAEDYMPFNINVTTDLRVFQNTPEGRRQRVVITPTSTAAPGAGGVAYIGSFNWTGDTPCWVFMTSGKACAEAASHEAGHTLGLGHDGADANGVHTEYYGGQGSGDTGWAPIMGVGYYQNVTQWSKGEYANANNTQDDLDIITSNNNEVDYRVDDTGDTLATSRYLELYSGNIARAQGVIEQTGDADAFRFTTSGGNVSLRADPVSTAPNLALEVGLYDQADSLIISSSPVTTLWANVSTNLPAGTYTFRVTGTGRNKPLTTGFSPYASLGFYSVSGSVAGARIPDRFNVAENTAAGTVLGTLGFQNPGTNTLSYNITAGNTGGAFGIDANGVLTVADSTPLDYEALALPTQLPVQFELFVDVVDTTDGTVLESDRRVVIAVLNVNEPPFLSDQTATVLEHTAPGTLVTTVTGSDPDFWTVLAYSIVDGNSDGAFAINSQSGAITVAGDLDTSTQSTYTLTVSVSDQTLPAALTATATVTINLLPNHSPFDPGSISYAVYTNLSGNTLASLTSSSRFPYDPAFEKRLTSFNADRDRGDNYGAALRGYLIPPADGNYTFWVSSDDNGELWLSTTTNNTGIKRIAYISGDGNWASPEEWTKFASQKSASVALKQGEAYYIEARLKEGGGGDHLEVAWECPEAGISQQIIGGKYLAPFPMNYVPHPAGFTNFVHRDAIAGARVGTVKVTDVNSSDVQTFSIVAGSLGGVFSFDTATGVFRVADEAALQQSAQTSFTFVVRATDNGSPARSGNATVSLNLVAAGAITTTALQQEIFSNIGSSTSVSGLTSNSKYPKRPDSLRALTDFDGGQNLADNYGSRIRALLKPASGTYYFYVSSDDASSLRMSTNSNPTNAVQIASVTASTDPKTWNAFSTQRSSPRSLSAGAKYYMEVLQKEGGGGDHVSVGWSGTGLSGTNVIPGSNLEVVDLNYAPDMASRSAQVLTTATNGTVIATMTAVDSPLDTLSYKITSGNPDHLFAIDPDSGVITLRDAGAISAYGDTTVNLTVLVQDSGYGGLYALQSTQATLSIQVIDASPIFTWSGSGSGNSWSDTANWTPGLPQTDARLVFLGTSRQTNVNELLTRVGLVTIQNSGFDLTGNPLVLLNGLASDGDSTWAIDSKLGRSQSFRARSGTLNISGTVDTDGNVLTVQATGSARVTGAVTGTGGLTKTGPGTLTLSTANPFTGPFQLAEGSAAIEAGDALAQCSGIQLLTGTVLDLSSSLEPLHLQPNQTLSGQGTILGDVQAGGILMPGAPTGALKIDGSIVLSGQMIVRLNKIGLTNAELSVTRTLTCGGTLAVTNMAGTLASGDTFKVLDAGTILGAFESVELPPLSGPLQWDTSRLMTEGILGVTVKPPQFYPVAVSNGRLYIQIDTYSGLNYELQMAESLSPGTPWTVVSTMPGSNGPLSMFLPMNTSKPQVYYRFRVYAP